MLLRVDGSAANYLIDWSTRVLADHIQIRLLKRGDSVPVASMVLTPVEAESFAHHLLDHANNINMSLDLEAPLLTPATPGSPPPSPH